MPVLYWKKVNIRKTRLEEKKRVGKSGERWQKLSVRKRKRKKSGEAYWWEEMGVKKENGSKIPNHVREKLLIHCILSHKQNCILWISHNLHLKTHLIQPACSNYSVKLLTFLRAFAVTPLSSPTKTYRGSRHHAAWINFKRRSIQREYGTHQRLKKISEKIGAGKFQAMQIEFLSKLYLNSHCNNSAFFSLRFIMCLCEL